MIKMTSMDSIRNDSNMLISLTCHSLQAPPFPFPVFLVPKHIRNRLDHCQSIGYLVP